MVVRAAWFCTDWAVLDKGDRSRCMLWSFSPSFYHSHGFASLTLKPSKPNTTETIFFCTNTSLLSFSVVPCLFPALILSGPPQYSFTFQVKNNSAYRILLLSWNMTEDRFQTVHFQGRNVNSFRTVKCFPCLEGVFLDFWWPVMLKEAEKLCPLIYNSFADS